MYTRCFFLGGEISVHIIMRRISSIFWEAPKVLWMSTESTEPASELFLRLSIKLKCY